MNASPTGRGTQLAVLRQQQFLRYSIARFCFGVGQGALQATFGYHIIYHLGGSPLDLAWLGFARVVPQLSMALYGGAFADTHNRKRIVVTAQAVPLLCAAVLAAASFSDAASAPLIFGLVAMMGFAGAFSGPAQQALLPALVPPESFQNAITVNSTSQTFSQLCGPALLGLLLLVGGVSASYLGSTLLMLVSVTLMMTLQPRAVAVPSRAISWATVREGIDFVRHRQPLLGTMTLDMFAVVFGGAQALLPVYAKMLGEEAVGYAILAGALPAGAAITSVVLVLLPPIHRLGRAMMVSVGIFAVVTIIFGASRWFPLSVAAYFLVGLSDQVSVVMRQTTLQLGSPDHLRGRVSAVNQIFVGTSNQIGAMESGFLAAATSTTFAVVSGGFASLAVLGTVAATMRQLWVYTIDDLKRDAEADNAVAAANGATRT